MNLKRAVFAVLLAAILLCHPGCYGSFDLTRNLHDWNADLDGKWTREGVFLLLVIIPVYGVSILVDAVILNSIEFWSGDNPIGGTSMTMDDGDRVVELSRIGIGRERLVRVRVIEEGEIMDEFYLVTDDSGATFKKDRYGRILACARPQPDGTILLSDAEDGTGMSFTRGNLARWFER